MIMAISCRKRCLERRFGTERNLPVSRFQIQRGEEFRSVEMQERLVNEWERVYVLDCDLIQCPVVNADTGGSICFGGDDDGEASG